MELKNALLNCLGQGLTLTTEMQSNTTIGLPGVSAFQVMVKIISKMMLMLLMTIQ